MPTTVNKNQTLLDRIDNLQNMLFVIDATKTEHVSRFFMVRHIRLSPRF